MIKPGEEIHGNGGQRLRVLAVVTVRRGRSRRPFVGLLQVDGRMNDESD
jgi:hypothetical protein